jgi:hypothetical protein
MINPQKGTGLMNNNSIINRILFLVTIFQHSPLTRRVFYNIIMKERERESTSTSSGTLIGISINRQKFFSSSISSSTTRSWNGIVIIYINMD